MFRPRTTDRSSIGKINLCRKELLKGVLKCVLQRKIVGIPHSLTATILFPGLYRERVDS